ncbi:MAG TPA: hypothetical protein VJK51_05090 [Candidatus Nanoarchaeia archaeon]|nr:hypothetical protein [Candidatus Nanoarchaeia archaeon]
MKKGAIELSVSTIVIIVLAMSMLILGLVLVRNIFTGATESVDVLDDKIKSEITKLFTEESSNVVIKLGTDKTIVVEPGDQNIGVAIGARTYDGSEVGRSERLQYKLSLDTNDKSCYKFLGETKTKNLFFTTVGRDVNFDSWQGSNAYARIVLTIPDGTPSCLQKVNVAVRDNDKTTGTTKEIGADVFYIEIKKVSLI